MKKPYEGHEIAYRKMRKQGIRSWGERPLVDGVDKAVEIDSDDKRFLLDSLGQPWSPRGGRVIELGCGTGPLLRWVCRKDFRGLGIDVSRTAIAMARSQSRDCQVSFRQADLCQVPSNIKGGFDLGIDGHCLHCIITDSDRQVYLKNAYDLLRPGGLFVLMGTMCSPVNRREFSKLIPGQRLIDGVLYSPYKKASEFQGSRRFNGNWYMPTRRILSWKTILKELNAAGFHIQMLRYNRYAGKDPCSCLNVAAMKD